MDTEIVGSPYRLLHGDVNIGVHQGSVLSQLLFAVAVDFITNDIKEGMK